MTTQLNRLAVAFGAAFLAVAMAAGYWGIARSDELNARGDNPRRVLAERRTGRGVILDRNDQVLASTTGVAGEYIRHYDYPDLAPVIGYVSPQFGSAGIEAALDGVLHGDDGVSAVEVYWRTHVLGLPPPGRGVKLTIDLGMQRAADAALGGSIGSVVVVNAQTGEILAMASHPTYDANQLDALWPNLVSDANAPLLNRATLALYQPGGALWPVVLAGVVENTVLDPLATYPADSPPVRIDGHELACRIAPSRQSVTLAEALAFACPGPIARVGQLSSSSLLDLFTAFELYSAPDIVIPTTADEATAAISDTTLAGLGQGELGVTPLHLALATAALVSGGRLPAPQLVLATQEPDGEWQTLLPVAGPRQAIGAAEAEFVKAMLAGGYEASALTSTAGKALAWYIGFAPAEDPEFVVTVLLENGDTAEARRVGEAVLAVLDD